MAKNGESSASDANKEEKQPSAEKIGGNVLSLGIGEILARVAAFVGTTFAARQLGPEQFGVVGFAIALFSYFSIAVSGGFNDIGSREVARRPREAAAIAANIIVFRLAIAFIAFAGLAMTACFLGKPPMVKLVIFLTGLLFFPLALDVSWVYKGLERSKLVALALIVGQILYAAIILLTVKEPDDVGFVPLAQFSGEIFAALILLVPLLRLEKIKPDWRKGFRLLRSSGFWAISRLMRAVMFSFDIVLIGFLLGEQAVGLYTAPYRICFLLVALAVAVHASYLPIITRAATSGSTLSEVGKIAERSLNFAAVVSAPLIVGGIIVSTPLLEAVFGEGYAEGSAAFRFLILSVGFVFLHGAIHNIFLTVNRLKTETMIFVAAAAANIGLNILIVPHYGIVGAAFVTALAEGLTLVLGLIVIRRIGIPFSLRCVWRPLLASIIMGAILISLGANHGLLLQLTTGAVSYLLALILVRGIPPDARLFFRTPTLIDNARGNSG